MRTVIMIAEPKSAVPSSATPTTVRIDPIRTRFLGCSSVSTGPGASRTVCCRYVITSDGAGDGAAPSGVTSDMDTTTPRVKIGVQNIDRTVDEDVDDRDHDHRAQQHRRITLLRCADDERAHSGQ